MIARHDWRRNPQEPSLEPVETRETWEAEEAAENGIPYAEELHDDAGRGWQPEGEASGELDDKVYASPCMVCGNSKRHNQTCPIMRERHLTPSRPAPTAEKALRETVERLKTALEEAARDFISQNGMKPEWWKAVLDLYDDRRVAALLAHEAPKEPQS